MNIRDVHVTRKHPKFFELIRKYAYLKQYEPEKQLLQRSETTIVDIKGGEKGEKKEGKNKGECKKERIGRKKKKKKVKVNKKGNML